MTSRKSSSSDEANLGFLSVSRKHLSITENEIRSFKKYDIARKLYIFTRYESLNSKTDFEFRCSEIYEFLLANLLFVRDLEYIELKISEKNNNEIESVL